MSSIIVAAPPVTGELQPLLQIAGGLVERGHTVTVLTGSRFGSQVAAVGASFVGLTGAADFDDRRLLATFPEVATIEPGDDQINWFFSLFGDAIPEEHQVLQTMLEGDPDAVLITNSCSSAPGRSRSARLGDGRADG